MSTPPEYQIRPPDKFSFNFKELWQYRELFYFFTWRDIKVKYKQTVFGFLWAILQPLAIMLVFTFFFARTLNIPTDGIPAPVFYYSGLLLWNFFSSGLSGAGNSMVNNAHIIKKIYFPRLIIPISSIIVALFDLLMALTIYLILIFYYDLTKSDFSLSYFMLFSTSVAAILLTILSLCGAGMFLAALNVQFRDFRYIIPFLIQFLFFITPVIYSTTIFSEIPHFQYIMAVNPMTGAIELARSAFTQQLDWMTVTISTFSAVVFMGVGIYTFRKMEAYFADIA
ncbi:MAG: ABC transporter permease [Bacteroidota bacterium]